jgi:hypothetical protein
MLVLGKVPAPRLGASCNLQNAPGRGLTIRGRFGRRGLWALDLNTRQPLLPAKAIWLGNLSLRRVTRRRPGMPVMKIDCQLLTRAFSG